ncbi:hypothetical protein P775_09425 [Puniceibacterium antarcticum]|uniref:histidine kinase n=1 Tax=Puniceibacterium antarcticum TaxID=1206336 RepID=A0A2G8RFS1_9RHOB|nr:ATP-binding protein [Puniceibacterium antarcticum]PIL20434.1 hypothetical protein P775_09425 [Puniceibacterium antarcticum]
MTISVESPAVAARLESVFEALGQCALIVDAQGAILAANPMFCKRAKVHPDGDSVSGQHLSDFFCGTWAELASDMRSAASSNRVTFELLGGAADPPGRIGFHVSGMRGGRGNGNQFLMVETSSDHVSEKFVALSRELTAANQKAAKVHRNYAVLENSYQELERFSYFAAHDLQAPLRNIANWLGFLKEDFGAGLPSEASEYLEMAVNAAQRMQELIDALLTLARSDTVEMRKEEVCVAEALRDVVATLDLQITEAGGRIEFGEPLGSVIADAALFRLLLQNLLGNALKYRAASRAPVIRMERIAAPSERAGLYIIDNGLGFEDQYKHQIFHPFKRLFAASEIKGSGVGLAICTRICKRHGWQLTAQGVPGQGATFRIVLAGE